jgi:hypothetical protein
MDERMPEPSATARSTGMIWVLLALAVCYGLAILPVGYSLFKVHGPNVTARLWGYAPNQFLFLTLVFPFAAFYSFMALRVLITEVRGQIPIGDPGRLILEHWPACILVGLAIVSLIATVVYFGSAMSLDKLRPPYAQMALDSMRAFEDKLSQVPVKQRQAKRVELIESARRRATRLDPPAGGDHKELVQWLRQREPEDALQFFIRPGAQLRLGVLEPTIHALNVFQLLVALFVSVMALMTSLLTIHAAGMLGFPQKPNPALREAITFLVTALFCFALYPLLYHQLRVQLEEFVGSGFSVLQDMLSAAVILVVMTWLSSLDPADRMLSLASIARFWPTAIVTGGYALAGFSPVIIRQLVGRDTTWAVQLMLGLLFVPLALVPWLQTLWRAR